MADNELRISEVPTGLVVAGGRLDKGVMTKASNFVTLRMPQVSGGWEHTPVDGPLPTTRLPNSRSICTSHVAGKMATTSKIGCVPRKNSYGVTRNCEVPRNKQDALNGVAQTWTGLSISTRDLSNISNGPAGGGGRPVGAPDRAMAQPLSDS